MRIGIAVRPGRPPRVELAVALCGAAARCAGAGDVRAVRRLGGELDDPQPEDGRIARRALSATTTRRTARAYRREIDETQSYFVTVGAVTMPRPAASARACLA